MIFRRRLAAGNHVGTTYERSRDVPLLLLGGRKFGHVRIICDCARPQAERWRLSHAAQRTRSPFGHLENQSRGEIANHNNQWVMTASYRSATTGPNGYEERHLFLDVAMVEKLNVRGSTPVLESWAIPMRLRVPCRTVTPFFLRGGLRLSIREREAESAQWETRGSSGIYEHLGPSTNGDISTPFVADFTLISTCMVEYLSSCSRKPVTIGPQGVMISGSFRT